MNIEINALHKKYGGHQVINNLNLILPEKETTMLMGKSGCGKTTLLKILSGLLDYEGQINGLANKKVSMVFQEDRLIPHYSALDNILFVSPNRSRAENLLACFGLKNEIHKAVKGFSGGMLRRVSIARALCADYDLILFDEAFKAMDEENKKNAMAICLKETKGKTVVMATHDEAEAQYFKGNIINMNPVLQQPL